MQVPTLLAQVGVGVPASLVLPATDVTCSVMKARRPMAIAPRPAVREVARTHWDREVLAKSKIPKLAVPARAAGQTAEQTSHLEPTADETSRAAVGPR